LTVILCVGGGDSQGFGFETISDLPVASGSDLRDDVHQSFTIFWLLGFDFLDRLGTWTWAMFASIARLQVAPACLVRQEEGGARIV